MISRLTTSRFIVPNGWQKVLSCKTIRIPKINHHTLISPISCKIYQQKLLEARPFHQKQQKDESIVKTAINSIRNSPYFRIMRLDKPIGSFLLFWPCGWSIALSASPGCLPDLYMLSLFAAGAVIMRGAGCTINDMWDRDIDGKVSRTSSRPLVTKEMTNLDAWFFLGFQLSFGLLILLELNWNTILLGASSLGLVIIYPLMKRITNWPQFILGMTFNWGALLGYCAVHGDVNWAACLPLYAAGISWTVIYDTIYAHQDRIDDLIVGVKSTALRFGKDTKKWLTGFGCVMTSCLLTTGQVCDMTWPYYASLGIVGAHIAQQVILILKVLDDFIN